MLGIQAQKFFSLLVKTGSAGSTWSLAAISTAKTAHGYTIKTESFILLEQLFGASLTEAIIEVLW